MLVFVYFFFVFFCAHIVISVSWKWEVAETCLELVHQVANRIWATLPLQYDRDPQTLVFGPGIWEGWGVSGRLGGVGGVGGWRNRRGSSLALAATLVRLVACASRHTAM